MKLAIVTTAFPESTFALMRSLLSKGHSVDVYYLRFEKNTYINTAAFEMKVPGCNYGSICRIHPNTIRGLDFLKETNSKGRLYYAQGFRNGAKLNWILRPIAWTISMYFVKRISNHLNRMGYDGIEIISNAPQIIGFIKYLDGQSVFSFHEVLNGHLLEQGLKSSVQKAIDCGKKIRVFSQAARDNILSIAPHATPLVNVIPFGLFVNYAYFGIDITEKYGKDYLLYFGLIHPYKGLSVLYDAIVELNKRGQNIKVVVAGKGDDPCLKEMKEDSHFVVINEFINNDELVGLIRGARALVCPYLSASQSGIPQTAYVFNKPVIASNVGAFPEMIKDNQLGILVPPSDHIKLADAINKLYTDSEFYRITENNIARFNELMPQYSWDVISDSYINLIRK